MTVARVYVCARPSVSQSFVASGSAARPSMCASYLRSFILCARGDMRGGGIYMRFLEKIFLGRMCVCGLLAGDGRSFCCRVKSFRLVSRVE